MRNIILSIVGLLLLVAAFFGGNVLLEKSNKKAPTYKKEVTKVYTSIVKNDTIPINLSASGSLTAKHKIELFSEVQGVLELSKKPFKSGTSFINNETLLRVNSKEFSANLFAQRSTLFSLITSILPDMHLDYPLAFEKWNSYLLDFDIRNSIPTLPSFASEQEKYFIAGRGVLTSYYNIKNLEIRLAKHSIKAPFSGILTEVLVTSGTLVRIGQKLGEYIDPGSYEMEVAINSEFINFLKIGAIVTLSNLGKTKEYAGRLARVNGKVDQVSQTIKVYIDVKHSDLKEGMFLEAKLAVKSETEALQVSRRLLVGGTSVYIVKNDSVLSLKTINPVYFSADNVVIKGLENNEVIVTQNIPGAFDGMIVNSSRNK
jgi:multidrug efflux pump subunit AcrA (membrane-fusion protein)